MGCQGKRGFDIGRRRIGRTNVKRFFFKIGDAMIFFKRWKGQHRDIPVIVAIDGFHLIGPVAVAEKRRIGFRLTQSRVEKPAAGDRGVAGDKMLHGLFAVDPGSTAARPARAAVQSDLQPQTLGFLNRMLEQGPPGRAHKFYRPARYAHIHLHGQDTADTRLRHGFEISGDALFG
ncbi:MAG: hypothetical protein BWY83_00175 [bacterium ADurb.Bin478]|nr:MAG: hypothetical protein BWY83_00175 [bacterium ADurb.Bin478]